MIPISSSARIWIATGYTDMRKSMQGLSLLVQEALVVVRSPEMPSYSVVPDRDGEDERC
jgi:hypothetical protein